MEKMTYEQALKETRLQAVISGGITQINGKQLTGKDGFWYLDGVKVEDPDNEVLAFVEVDENAVRALMG